MRRAHFDRFAPVCPVCVAAGRPASALVIHHVEHHVELEADDDIVTGSLACGAPTCRFEYPILDGVPILVPNLREVVQNQLDVLRARDDLSPWVESVLGDCAGPGSDFDRTRYHLSTYARSHWGDLEPDAPAPRGEGATLPALLDAALALAPAPGDVSGAWLDLGCSVGRSTFELAARTGELVLGIDLNLAMLKVARRILADGRARYPRRKVGIVYDRADFAIDPPGRARVDFWCADVTALPFAAGVAAGALSLNVLDCVSWPLSHLLETGRVVAPGGVALFATPYDWSPGATAVEGWLGGHSQRGPLAGSSPAELRRILSADDAARAGTGLAIIAERDDVPWQVYVHERATMMYRAHVFAARRA